MHIHFIGIGGAGIGPLAIVAQKAGYRISGSDKINSKTVEYLKSIGIKDIFIGNNEEGLKHFNNKDRINWIVYSSALMVSEDHLGILNYAKLHNIKISKRDLFLNEILKAKKLKLIAISGTHGKTTTTAMLTWLFKSFNIEISYLLPAQTSFAELGDYKEKSQFFIYEADEFDYNFLSFSPEISIISGVSYDHHEIFKTRQIYKDAFIKFINQSKKTIIYDEDVKYLNLKSSPRIEIVNREDELISGIELFGIYNRQDAYLVSRVFSNITKYSLQNIISVVSQFPGLHRRMEQIYPNLYSDYAHTPEKIRAALNTAREMLQATSQKLVVIYEPLTNRRQLYIQNDYKDTFNGVDKLYWIDSYLAREDPKDPIISPKELIAKIADPSIAEAKSRNKELLNIIKLHLKNGDFILALNGGGGGGLDEWLRDNFLP